MKTVQTKGEKLVIICDKELLGRRFKEGKLQIEVKKSFYDGSEVSVAECIEALRGATIANLLGSIVKNAISAGIIDQNNVIKIQNVLHAQFVRI